ncbi:MAG: aldehyde dehydrogenase, partial [Acidobacteria bacterium]
MAAGANLRSQNTSTLLIGETLATVAQGTEADVHTAVRAAGAAFPKWQALTPHTRARYLYALARTIQKHSRRLAVLETMDNGKP